ncbi:MAG TPA: DoxX family protein [Bacteroidales bacterium]|nr:DoxX family protein [Bacteroidales bacterium]
MKILRNILRIVVGIVFIFSGFVKGIDPLGTVFRMDDYFVAFGMTGFMPFSLYLTILLCTLEFLLGISLLFNLWIKKMAWLLLAMMLYFTVLTFFDATFNIVPDCGCFGDAIKLSNIATFLKNLVLMAMVLPIFFWRKKYRSLLSVRGDVALLAVIAIGFGSMSVYCHRHLPLIDFMGWKVGNRVNKKEMLPVTFYVTYKNKTTGEEKEFVSPNYPWNDSVWLSNWIFTSQRVVDPNKDQGLVLRVEDEFGADYTASILDNPDYQFILVAYDLAKTDREGFRKILPLYKKATFDGHSFICLTNTLPADIKKFRIANGTAFDFYNADDVVLKTMVRSNPGLVLLKNGIVIGKWGWRDFPSYDEMKKRYMKE